ncbi:MAG: S-layer homology domain-containing protein [Oscillospiraceae bacterium]|nr:S-layer homology domain-containing protein [Oscillospiraceae bacterium]
MKKIGSLLLALSLCLSMSAPALAGAASPSFADVSKGDWYYDGVCWAMEHNLTQGVSESEFGADAALVRADLVTCLWRLAGSPEPMAEHGFADVAEDAWYADAANWAVEHGIVDAADTFAPDEELTREQAAVYLYREEQRRGGGFTGAWAFPLRFADADRVGEDAYEPLCYLSMNSVIRGSGDDTLAPDAICTRAQFLTMLYRYAEEMTAPEDPAYTEKDVPVLRESLESDETARLRFYEDMPNVPYMELTQYYNQFYLLATERTEGVTASRIGTHFSLANFGGYTAEADTRTDTIVTDDLESFTNLGYYLELELSGESDENYPFLLDEYSETEPENPVPRTLRLGEYGIDLRGGEDGLYLPLATLSDIYSLQYRVMVYNGEKIYAQDYMGTLQPGSAMAEDESFTEALKKERGEDLAEFTYRELCFNIDTFYGCPGREYLHEALESGKTLDDILSEDYPEVKEQLCSTDFGEYYTGLYLLLDGLLFDGGHTCVASEALMGDEELSQNAMAALMEADYGAGLFTAVFKELFGMMIKAIQEEAYGGDYYIEKGDTAMIRFGEFNVDNEAWKAFYAGEGEMPVEGDTLGTVYAGLQRAASNPEIKNVVIDISCNGGGNSGAMIAVEWLTTGKGYVKCEDLLTGQVGVSGCGLDVNFDGVFDENDQPFTQFNYGVLTSNSSFSCANAFPFFMKDHGAMILGQQSGGGACSVRFSMAGGVEIASASPGMRIVNDAGESVELGCPVDIDLYQAPEGSAVDFGGIDDLVGLAELGMENGAQTEMNAEAEAAMGEEMENTATGYEPFYDLDVISAAMNEFFGAAAEDAA